MPRAAVRTIVVAHARPFVRPWGVAAVAKVVIKEPSHLFPRRVRIANDNSLARQNRDIPDPTTLEVAAEFFVLHAYCLDRGRLAIFQIDRHRQD